MGSLFVVVKDQLHARKPLGKALTMIVAQKTRMMLPVVGTAILLLLLAAPAGAEDLRPLCPDRPGKGTSPCTLDTGHAQVEIDAFDASFQRLDGVTTDTYLAGAPTMKYGLADTLDIEAAMALYEHVRTHDALSDASVSGVGDLYLRAKWNFLDAGDGPFTAVLAPFVKLPTASRNLGNGKIESGLVLPMGYDLGGGWALGSTPEADLLHDGVGTGYHLDLIDVVRSYRRAVSQDRDVNQRPSRFHWRRAVRPEREDECLDAPVSFAGGERPDAAGGVHHVGHASGHRPDPRRHRYRADAVPDPVVTVRRCQKRREMPV